MKVAWIGVAAWFLAACSSPAVRCDTHLTPINPPGKVGRAPATESPPTLRRVP